MAEDREKLYREYQGEKNPFIERTMIVYDRYSEAGFVSSSLKDLISELRVLDYGCGVGDYGLHFARQGVKFVGFYDFEPYLNFVMYRVEKEDGKMPQMVFINAEMTIGSFRDYNLVIFGEVLEHLENPMEVLQQCINDRVRFIFTTAYPFVTDYDYFKKSGHTLAAGEMQDRFKFLLETNYNLKAYGGGGRRLWEIK